jgi:hypothetical protein
MFKQFAHLNVHLALTIRSVRHVLAQFKPIHLGYYQAVLVLRLVISMPILTTLNVRPACHNAIIVQIIFLAFLVLATQLGTIVVQPLNVAALQAHSAIYHSNSTV